MRRAHPGKNTCGDIYTVYIHACIYIHAYAYSYHVEVFALNKHAVGCSPDMIQTVHTDTYTNRHEHGFLRTGICT